MKTTARPWGSYEILYDGGDFKVKKITINPGQEISYQYHEKREELWHIIDGSGIVTINEETDKVNPGTTIRIPKLSRHTIKNTNKNKELIFVEVQTGEYFGEDDIVRLKDKYGRVKNNKLQKRSNKS